jgi:hypothetical protein
VTIGEAVLLELTTGLPLRRWLAVTGRFVASRIRGRWKFKFCGRFGRGEIR